MPNTADLQPWAVRPFELITHGEIHFLRGSDYDRRLSITSFDNSVEVSITTYLHLHPTQRGGREYSSADVSGWLRNYHTKLDFFMEENERRGLPEHQDKSVIVWYHGQRNEQYHGAGAGVPERATLEGIRRAALWVFSVLFEVTNLDEILSSTVEPILSPPASMPDDLIAPELDSPYANLSNEQAQSVAAASLLGKWEEDSEADQQIARRLSDEF